jgi:hypothetical protein
VERHGDVLHTLLWHVDWSGVAGLLAVAAALWFGHRAHQLSKVIREHSERRQRQMRRAYRIAALFELRSIELRARHCKSMLQSAFDSLDPTKIASTFRGFQLLPGFTPTGHLGQFDSLGDFGDATVDAIASAVAVATDVDKLLGYWSDGAPNDDAGIVRFVTAGKAYRASFEGPLEKLSATAKEAIEALEAAR